MSDPYSTHPYPEKTPEVRRRWAAATIKGTKTYQGLAAVRDACDAARTVDGIGFSSHDCTFARDVLDKGARFGWTERQFAAAHKMAYKYRVQIGKLAGITEVQLAEEANYALDHPFDEKGPPRSGDQLVWVRGAGPVRMGLFESDRSHQVLRKGEFSFRGTGKIVFLPKSLVKNIRGEEFDPRRCQYDNMEFQVPRWWADKHPTSVDIVPDEPAKDEAAA